MRLHEAFVGVVAALLAVGAARVAPVGAGEDDAAPDGIDGPFDAVYGFHVEKTGRRAADSRFGADGTVLGKPAPDVGNLLFRGNADDFRAAAQVARGGDRGPSGEGLGVPGVFDAEAADEGAGFRVSDRALDRFRRKRDRHFVGAAPLPFALAFAGDAPEAVDLVGPRAAALALHFAERASAARVRLFDEGKLPEVLEIVEDGDADRRVFGTFGGNRGDAGRDFGLAALGAGGERESRTDGLQLSVRFAPGDGIAVPLGGLRRGGKGDGEKKGDGGREGGSMFHVS